MKTTTVLLLAAGAATACYFLYLRPKSAAAAQPAQPASPSPQPAGAPPPFVPGVLDQDELLKKIPVPTSPAGIPGIPNLPPPGGAPPPFQPPPSTIPGIPSNSPELLALLNPLGV